MNAPRSVGRTSDIFAAGLGWASERLSNSMSKCRSLTFPNTLKSCEFGASLGTKIVHCDGQATVRAEPRICGVLAARRRTRRCAWEQLLEGRGGPVRVPLTMAARR